MTPSLLLADAGPSSAGAAFDPSLIAGREFQLDPAQISGVSVDGTAVASWTDVSGAGHHFLQATGANQPVFKTNIVNGLPVVRFDSVNDTMAPASWPADASRTIFFVAKGTAGDIATWGSGNAAIRRDTGAGTTWEYATTQAAGTQAFGALAPWVVLTLRSNSAASMDLYYNNGAATNIDPNDQFSTATSFNLGSDSGIASFFNGDIGYGLGYDSALSNPNVVLVQNWLGARFGLF